MISDKKDDVTQELLEWFSSHIKTIIVFFIFAVAAVFTAFIFLRGNDSIEVWGQSGDFIGGWLNPIVAIANLAFLVYLTLLIKHRDDHADEKAIEAQRSISLNQFRHEAYIDIKKQFELVDSFPNTYSEMRKELQIIRGYITRLNSFNSYLFEGNEFSNILEELDETATELHKSILPLKEGMPWVDYFKETTEEEKRYKELTDLYMHLKLELLKVAQYSILGKTYFRQEVEPIKWNIIITEK